MARDMDQMLNQVSRLPGWTVHLRKAGHWVVTSPGGEQHFVSGTPSDSRSIKNVRAALRRLGAEL